MTRHRVSPAVGDRGGQKCISDTVIHQIFTHVRCVSVEWRVMIEQTG